MLEDSRFKSVFLEDAWSTFAHRYESYRTHTMIDVNELISDLLGSLHVSLTLPRMWSGQNIAEGTGMLDRSLPPSSPRQTISASNTSPVFAAIGGEIEKYLLCKNCGKFTSRLENFISLNFKKLQESEVQEIRRKFEHQGYAEGMVTKQSPEKRGLLSKFLNRKPKVIPLVTIRDYLCHLNLLQREFVEDVCSHCEAKSMMESTLTLSEAPSVLQIGFSANEETKTQHDLQFQLELEFDPSAFFKQPCHKYQLQSVVSLEEGVLGIVHYATYFRDASDGWLKSNL